MCFLPLKSSHYPSRPVPVPELFCKYPTRPVPKSKTPTRRTLPLASGLFSPQLEVRPHWQGTRKGDVAGQVKLFCSISFIRCKNSNLDILDFIIGRAWFFPLLGFLCKLEKHYKKHFVWLRLLWFPIPASRSPSEFLTCHIWDRLKLFQFTIDRSPDTAKNIRMNYIHPMCRRPPSITFFQLHEDKSSKRFE